MRKNQGIRTKIVFVIALLPLCSVNFYSQDSLTEKAREVVTWRERTHFLADGVIQDSSAVRTADKLVFLTLLSKVIWKADNAKARKQLGRSIDLTMSWLGSDEEPDFEAKFRIAQKVVEIAATLDEKVAQSTSEKFLKIAEDRKGSDTANADMLVSIARQVLEKDPHLAFKFAVRSLSLGNSLQLPALLLALNLKDSQLADQLYRLSILAARRNYSFEFVGSLGNITFLVRKGIAFSDAARIAYLEMLADLVASAALIEWERPVRCGVAELATPVLDRFDQYIPSRALTVRQHVQLCLPFAHAFTSGVSKSQASEEKSETVEELLQRARETSDVALKGKYLYQAIKKLEASKKFEALISLLDDLTEEERKSLGNGAWDSWRAEYAFQACVIYFFEAKDLPSVYRVIEKTPKRLRSYVRISLAFKLSPTGDKDILLENLEKTRSEIESLEVAPKDAAADYLALILLYVKVQPTALNLVFRDTVKFINAADRENEEFKTHKDYAPLKDIVQLPWEILAVDEQGVFNSLQDISSRRSRIRLKLGLLESSLKKLIQAEKELKIEQSKRQK